MHLVDALDYGASGQEATLTTGGFLEAELNIDRCTNCGGELRIIAAVLEAPVIERILTHLGLQARAPTHADTCSKQPDRT